MKSPPRPRPRVHVGSNKTCLPVRGAAVAYYRTIPSRTRSLLLFKCAAWTEQGYCCSFAAPRKRIIQRSAAQRERSSRVEFLSLAGAQVCGVWLQSYCDTFIAKPPTALLTLPRLKKKARLRPCLFGQMSNGTASSRDAVRYAPAAFDEADADSHPYGTCSRIFSLITSLASIAFFFFFFSCAAR